MAAPQSILCQVLGWTPQQAPSQVGFALNAAASGGFSQNWLALGFFTDTARTLNTVRVYIQGVTGTLGTTDLVCDVYSNNGNASPGTSLESHTLGSAPTGAGEITFSGFATALANFTEYWIVLRNANAAPTTNYPTYAYAQNILQQAAAGQGNAPSWAKMQSTNGGASFTSITGPATCLRLGFSDGTFAGFMLDGTIASPGQVYGTRASGVKFTVPPNGAWNIRGLSFIPKTKTGNPSGTPQYQLFTGANPAIGSPLATCAALPTNSLNGSIFYPAYFPSTVTVQPGTIVRAVLCDSNTADAAGNYFSLNEYTFDADSCSGGTVNLMPLAGTAQKTYFDGTSWTDTPTVLMPFALILDSNGEFASAGGGVTIITPAKRLTVVRGFSPSRDRIVPIPAAAPAAQTVPINRIRPYLVTRPERRQRFVPIVAPPRPLPIPRTRIVTRRETVRQVRSSVIASGGHPIVINRPILVR